MKYILSIILIFSAFNMNVQAIGKDNESPSKLTFGLEWGYVATIHAGFQNNFFAPEGYRVDEAWHTFRHYSNAEMYAHIGWNLNPKWNISLYVGYEGLADFHKALPVSVRMTRFFNDDTASDRWFSFIDLGSGICLKTPLREILTGKTGGGWRMALSAGTSLDFLVSAKFTYTHPNIIYDRIPISSANTNRNNAYLTALSIGMAINF